MPTNLSEKEKARRKSYLQNNVTAFDLKFSLVKDGDILARLDTVISKHGYIRALIRNDLISKGIIPGPFEHYEFISHRGPIKAGPYMQRVTLKLVTGGPDQPIIDYLNQCPSRMNYLRGLIRQDIDSGGVIADRMTEEKPYVTVETVLASAERTSALLRDFVAQDDQNNTRAASDAIKSITTWINENK